MRWPLLAAALLALLGTATASGAVDPPPLRFNDLPGWREDDHYAALATFRSSCRAVVENLPAASGALPPSAELVAVCGLALAEPDADGGAARSFFERWFDPVEVAPAGFLTGYYEPELAGSLAPHPAFPVPLLALPEDAVPLPVAGSPPALEGVTAARRSAAGLEPYPDRAAIEDGALGALAVPVAYLADPVDAFMVHVQGSARIRLPDGGAIRVGFAGRNGHPYTAVGRVLARELDVAPAEVTADRLVAWLKANPDRAPAILRRNRSYIFFRRYEAASGGPLGAAGVALTAGRSLAVDRSRWSYGTPIWLEGAIPRASGESESLRRLVVAQDTGAAIVGQGRGDLFFGSGDAAGARASPVRHHVRVVALRPRAAAAPR